MSAPRPHQRVGRFDEMPADEAKALMEAMDSMDVTTDQTQYLIELLRLAESQLYQNAEAFVEINHNQNAEPAFDAAERITAALAAMKEGGQSLCQFCHDAGAFSCACFDAAEMGDRP